MRALGALLPLVLAGCLVAPTEPVGLVPAGALALDDAGFLSLDIPVDVVVIGFEAGFADALAARLEDRTLRHAWKEDWRDVPPDPERPPHLPSFSDAYHPLALVPTATYRVHEMPQAFADRFFAASAATRIAAASARVYDANAAEDWLARELPQVGIALDPARPLLVLLHGEAALGPAHAWRYTYAAGYLEPVRVFGERHPLLALDAGAIEDPWVADRDETSDASYVALVGGVLEPVQPYDRPLPRGGEASVAALAKAVGDATDYRLLQGSIYRPSTRECHAVTLLLAVRQTSFTGVVPGTPAPANLVDADRLRAGWEGVLGVGNVTVDAKILRLPQDDPALDVLTRAALGVPGSTRGGSDPLRYWVVENWDRYWVPHEGCEGYVSIVVLGDVAETNGGIALIDTKDGRRMSISWASDLDRAPPLGLPALPVFGEESDVSRTGYDYVNLLFSHETGHLFGQNHPHNTFREDVGRIELRSFSSIWSPMSYQIGDRTVEFGAVERANFERNRAAFAVTDAVAAGVDEATLAHALDALRAYRWDDAYATLLPAIEAAR